MCIITFTRDCPIPTGVATCTCKHIPVAFARSRCHGANEINDKITEGTVIITTTLMSCNDGARLGCRTDEAQPNEHANIGKHLLPPTPGILNRLYCAISIPMRANGSATKQYDNVSTQT